MLTEFIGWVLRTVTTAAEAEMNDDTALRERLLEAEMRREAGEISDEAFAALEADLLARIREIRERRTGAGPLTLSGAGPLDAGPGGRLEVEASVTGDFHEPLDAPQTRVVTADAQRREEIAVLDLDAGPADPRPRPAPRRRRASRRPRPRRSGS